MPYVLPGTIRLLLAFTITHFGQQITTEFHRQRWRYGIPCSLLQQQHFYSGTFWLQEILQLQEHSLQCTRMTILHRTPQQIFWKEKSVQKERCRFLLEI